MSSPDPEDTTRPETPRRSDDVPPGSAGARRFELPEDVDAEFAAIVAEWAGTDAPRWPEGDRPSSGVGLATPPQGQPEAHPERRPGDLFAEGPGAPGPDSPTLPPETPRARPPRSDAVVPPPPQREPGRVAPTGAAKPGDHFVPPEPPPLPRIGFSSLLGLLLLVFGVVLLALPALVGGGLGGFGLVPGLLAMAAGLGWLVVGMRRSSDDEAGQDDGGTL
jgi:hypothetical protein